MESNYMKRYFICQTLINFRLFQFVGNLNALLVNYWKSFLESVSMIMQVVLKLFLFLLTLKDVSVQYFIYRDILHFNKCV